MSHYKAEVESIVPSSRVIKATILIGIIVAGIVVGLFTCVVFIGVNEVAVTYDALSPAQNRQLTISSTGPGTVTKLPWWGANKVSLSIQTEQMWTDWDDKGNKIAEGGDKDNPGQFPALDSPTKEGLFVYVDATTRWHVASNALSVLYQKYPGGTWRQDYVIPIIRQIVRDTTGGNSAIEIYGPKRVAIAAAIESQLRTTFDKDGWIVLDGFNLRKVDLDYNFLQSIENKLIAEQALETAQFQRSTKLVEANATAQATIIMAQGTAEATKILADQYHSMSQQELNAYLTFLYIQALQQGMISGNKVIILLPQPNGSTLTLLLPTPQ